MNCTLVKTIKTGKDTYNVICIENDNVYDYYLQKVGYGDLKYIFGLIKQITLPDYLILNEIEFATTQHFWID